MVISYMMYKLLWKYGYHGYIIYDVSAVVEAWLPWLYHI